MENPEKIIQKSEKGEARVRGVHIPEPKKPKSMATTEGSAHNADQNATDAKADAQAQATAQEITKAPKLKKEKKLKEPKPKESKAPEEPKVAEFPFKATINPYGFIGLGKGELRALGLKVCEEKGAKKKLAKEASITFSAWNPETRELTIKIV